MSDTSIRPLSADLLEAPTEGRNLAVGPLAAQLGSEPTLVVFLRHFG